MQVHICDKHLNYVAVVCTSCIVIMCFAAGIYCNPDSFILCTYKECESSEYYTRKKYSASAFMLCVQAETSMRWPYNLQHNYRSFPVVRWLSRPMRLPSICCRFASHHMNELGSRSKRSVERSIGLTSSSYRPTIQFTILNDTPESPQPRSERHTCGHPSLGLSRPNLSLKDTPGFTPACI